MSLQLTAFHRVMLFDFCRYFVLGSIALGSVLLVASLGELMDGAVHFGAYTLEIVYRIVPMALLVAALFTVGIRSRYFEVMALNSAGYSLAQVTWPLLIPAVVGFAVILAVVHLGSGQSVGNRAIAGGGGEGVGGALAHAMLSVVAVLGGIVAAAGNRRPHVSSGFLSAAVLLVMYYLLDAVVVALGKHSGLPSVLVTWLPIALAGIPATALWLRGGWR